MKDFDRQAFYYSAEETRRKNDEIIKQLKKENKDLKKLRDDLLANKRVNKINLIRHKYTKKGINSWIFANSSIFFIMERRY